MLRRFGLALAIAAAVVYTHADVHGCGDKFLRVGRSARFRQYASVHPSTILVYAPQWTGRGINDFETMLKRAGHKPITVTTEQALMQALTTVRYQVVITSYREAAAIRAALQDARSAAALLPVVYKATKGEAEDARAAYVCLIQPEKMTKFEALEEIDRLLESRSRRTSPAGTR